MDGHLQANSSNKIQSNFKSKELLNSKAASDSNTLKCTVAARKGKQFLLSFSSYTETFTATHKKTDERMECCLSPVAGSSAHMSAQAPIKNNTDLNCQSETKGKSAELSH